MPAGDQGSGISTAPVPGGGIDAAAVRSLIQDDEDVRKRVKVLLIMALEQSIRVMREGSPSEKMMMTRSLLPAVTKAMATKEDGGVDDIRAQLARLQEAAFGEGG